MGRYFAISKDEIETIIRDALDKAIDIKYDEINFNRLCEETRLANCNYNKELEDSGYRGFTGIGKAGWSEDGHFFAGNTSVHPQWRGVINPELYWMMIQASGKQNFWTEDNKKERNRFIRQYIFGEGSAETRVFGYGKNDKTVSGIKVTA